MKIGHAGLWVLGIVLGGVLESGARSTEEAKKHVVVSALDDQSQQRSWHPAEVGESLAKHIAQALEQTGYVIAAVDSQAETLLLKGSVSEFGYQQPFDGRPLARCVLTLQLVDKTSGRILGSTRGAGQTSFYRTAGPSKALLEVALDSRKFDETPLGRATHKAIQDSVMDLLDYLKAAPFYRQVVQAEGETVFLNTGEGDGRRAGDALEVWRPGAGFVDPESGEYIGSDKIKIGRVQITRVIGQRLALAKRIDGQLVQVGDLVLNAGPR